MPSGDFWDRVRPWECANCHKQNISANQTECPKCGVARPGTAEAIAQDATGQTTRVYEGEKALQAGIREMAKLGWRVVSQSSHQPSSGVGRTVALGIIGAAMFK